MHAVRVAVLIVACLSTVGGCHRPASRRDSAAEPPRSLIPEPPPLFVESTSSTGAVLSNGDLQAQTVTAVGPGRETTDRMPYCLGMDRDNAGAAARCATVCVKIPELASITRVEGFAYERAPGSHWMPCTPMCALADASFEPTGPDHFAASIWTMVCWRFRNWSVNRTRGVVLLVTYHLGNKS